MPWFRFRKKKSSDDQRSDVPELEAKPPKLDQPKLTDPAAEAAGSEPTDPTKPKRRRGSRGGRGRKKPGSTAGAAAPERKEKAEPKQPQRRELSQRQERRRDQSTRRRREPQRRAPLPAAKRELLVSVDVGERRVAILEDGQAAEVYLERPERRSIAGNIYLGRVDNVLPGMEAAFVEIGLEKNGFLYVDEIVSPELEQGHGRKIQDLISRGQTILVQAVKDPMKTKGARLTTQISLPGRFVVLVPQGEGLGVSRRLDDDERNRLKDILKRLDVKEGGVIVRTAAEGASEEDIERDLVFLQRLWKSIQAKAKSAKPPELVYQEAELPLRVVRDLFTGDFEKAYVDDELTYRRVVGYLKKTSPHMVERLVRYKDKTPLMEAFGVEQEIKSTIGRRVDLPSGGYLIFDYAEAFTVIDVNTGRFVGGRGKNAGGRLEDTITKNNLEAVKEVVRQLRLRDIGGIIVIDFIDMANPKNRATVEEALRSGARARPDEDVRRRDLAARARGDDAPERDRRSARGDDAQVPDLRGRRDRLLRGLRGHRCRAAAARARGAARGRRRSGSSSPTRSRARSSAPAPGGCSSSRRSRRSASSSRESLRRTSTTSSSSARASSPTWPRRRLWGRTRRSMLQLVEVDRYDGAAAVGKLDGLDVVVADAASQVGKRVKVRIERVLDGRAYAVAIRKTKAAPEPLTAEGEAEKPTRKPPARKGAAVAKEAEPPRWKSPWSRRSRRSRPKARPRRSWKPRRRRKPRRLRSRRRRRGAARAAAASGRRRLRRPKLPRPRPELPRRKRRSRRAPSRSTSPARNSAAAARPRPAEEAPAEPEPEATEEPTTAEAAQEMRRSWTSLAARRRLRRRRLQRQEEEEDAAWLPRRPEPEEEAGAAAAQNGAEAVAEARACSGGRARRGERRFRLRPDVRVGRRARVKGLATLPTRGRPARVSTP